MGTALPFIMAGLSVVQGIQGMSQANAAAKATQQATDANIQNEKNRLAVEKTKKQRELIQEQGKSRVAAAASGATISSFDDVMDDSYSQGLLDVALLEYDSKLNQEQMRYSGGVQKAEYQNQAKSSLLEGIGKAGMQGYSGYQGLKSAPASSWNYQSPSVKGGTYIKP